MFACIVVVYLLRILVPSVIQNSMIDSWNFCSNWCFSGWRFSRSLIPAEVWSTLSKIKCRDSFFSSNKCSLWRRLRVVGMVFFASCHSTFVEVMHIIFVWFSFHEVLMVLLGLCFLPFFVRHVQFLPLLSSQKVIRELRGSTIRNITTIEVALTGKSWTKFFFPDAQSVKLAFRAIYWNYSPNVRENQSCVRVQMDHTEQHSSRESSKIEKKFWNLICLGWLFFEMSFVITNGWNEFSFNTGTDLKWSEFFRTYFHLFYKSSSFWSSKWNNRFFFHRSPCAFFTNATCSRELELILHVCDCGIKLNWGCPFSEKHTFSLSKVWHAKGPHFDHISQSLMTSKC